MEIVLSEFLLLTGIILVVGYFFYRFGSLDLKGFVAACLAGVFTYYLGQLNGAKEFSGIYMLFVMFGFFLIGDIVTRIGRKNSREKHEIRTTENIIGNAGAAIIALALNSGIAYHGAIAAALADTMSGEIGMLSKSRPLLITTFKPVEKGSDGGITALGILSGIIGGLIIGGLSFYWLGNMKFAMATAIGGLSGSLMDSFLGALFERKKYLNNMQVNFLASSSGAVVAFLIFTFL